MDAELKNLQIDRSKRRSAEPSKWATRWIVGGVLILLLLGGWRFVAEKFNPAPVVEVQRVQSIRAGSAPEGVILNATGYIVAAHKIEVAAKVIGRVLWIGVDKGDRVKEGQVIVRLEDDEYQAQLTQAKGQLASLQAKLDQAVNGSRPEEVAQAVANVNTARSDLDNARITLDRNKRLLKEGVVAQQVIDDAQARYDNALHRVTSLQKTLELVQLERPRRRTISFGAQWSRPPAR